MKRALVWFDRNRQMVKDLLHMIASSTACFIFAAVQVW